MTGPKSETEITSLAPGILRLRAPNSGPMTFTGTNTYMIGAGARAVIDPGPTDSAHMDAILGVLEEGETISHIFVTHAHRDHSPLAAPLAKRTGAKIYAFGTAQAGRSDIMRRLAEEQKARSDTTLGGGEGVDESFEPDVILACGDTVTAPSWSLTALHTPGHFCNHLTFLMGDIAFTGDHIMGWSSTLISPPDGDLADYFASLARVEAAAPRLCYPGHGEPITSPTTKIAELRAHRELRSRQILDALRDGPATANSLAARLYTTIPPKLLPAATRNTLAHLIDLASKNKISHAEPLQTLTEFRLP